MQLKISMRMLLLTLLAVFGAFMAPSPVAHAQTGTPPTGSICLSGFDDANANGALDTGEGPVSGVLFTVRDSSHVIATHQTNDQAEPFCVGLLPGTYRISALAPEGRTSTSDQSWDAAVEPNVAFNVAFASQAGAGNAASDPLALAFGLSGLCLMGAAVVVFGVMVFQARRN